MKQKIHAGAEFDAATPKEVAHLIATGLKSWQQESISGIHFPRFSSQVNITNGAFVLAGEARGRERLGPSDGFVWDIRRIHITGLNGADTATIWINGESPSTLVADTSDVANAAGSGNLFLFDRQVILQGGETLIVAGSGLVASTGQVTINGQAIEVPVQHQWRLIG